MKTYRLRVHCPECPARNQRIRAGYPAPDYCARCGAVIREWSRGTPGGGREYFTREGYSTVTTRTGRVVYSTIPWRVANGVA